MKLVIACCPLFPAVLRAQHLRTETQTEARNRSTETAQAFDCCVQSAMRGSVSKPELVIPKPPARLPPCQEPVDSFSAVRAAAAGSSASGAK